MNLPEFITYCTLKNLIVTHERMDNEWHANVCNRKKLVIENADFLAGITYTHFAGEYHVLHTSLSEVFTTRDEPLAHNGLESIISRFA